LKKYLKEVGIGWIAKSAFTPLEMQLNLLTVAVKGQDDNYF